MGREGVDEGRAVKLGELARRVGTTTASVKFYIRAGLLPAGRKLNQTTAAYDEGHVKRLELILGFRSIIGTPLARIGDLTAVIDDPGAGALDVMETAQTIAAEGSGGSAADRGSSVPASTDGGTDGGTAASTDVDPDTDPAGASAKVARLLAEQDWPDRQSVARAAVEQRLRRMGGLGVELGSESLSRIAEAVGSIGVLDLDVEEGTRDELALGVAVGTYEVSQLVVDMLRLAHTSHSIHSVDGDAHAQ